MIHRFLDFELDEGRFELRRGGRVIPTQARAFKLLVRLVHHRDRVVTKRELIDSVWEGTIVTEAAISQAVMAARRALDDEKQALILTVRGQGFRFAADVRVGEAEAQVAKEPKSRAWSRPLDSPELGPHGRESELATLRRQVEQAERGRSVFSLIEGEPGIGKSWLVDELARCVVARGGDVWLGRAWEDQDAPPLWPFIRVLRAIVEATGEESLRARVGPCMDELLDLLPERSRAPGQASLAQRAAEGASPERFRLFDGMARLLRSACTEGPAARVLILEDLHAFDALSLLLLRFLVQQQADCPLLIVGTYCSLGLGCNQVALAIVSSLRDAACHLSLLGLSEADVQTQLEPRFGRLPPERTMALMHQLSAGNPLLVKALSRGPLAESSDGLDELMALATQPLPSRIASAVRGHLAALPEDTRALLSVAAVMGRQFSLPLLSAVLGDAESTLLKRLDAALAAQVVRGSATGQFSFAHAVVSTVIYHDLAYARRVALHRCIAERLEQRNAERLPVDELAHHYFMAAADGSRAKAIAYSRAAADRACETANHRAGATLYDRALALSTLEAVTCSTRQALWMQAGEAWYRAGEHERAHERFCRAAEVAEADGDALCAARAIARGYYVLRMQLLEASALQPLRDALARLPQANAAVRAMTLVARGLGYQAGSREERDAVTGEGVALARRAGDRWVLCWTLTVRHLSLLGLADPAELRTVVSEALELARAMGDGELVLDLLTWHSFHSVQLGDGPTVLQNRAAQTALQKPGATPLHRYVEMSTRATEAAMTGSFALAQQLSATAAELGARVDPAAAIHHDVRSLFAFVHYGFGEGQVVDRPLEAVPPLQRPFWSLAWAREDRADDARRVLRHFFAGGVHQPNTNMLRGPTWAALSELSVLLGERDPARELGELLLPWAGLHLVLPSGVYFGPVSYYLAMVAAASNGARSAEQHFEAALAETLAVGALPFLARVRNTYGSWLATQKPARSRATQLLVEAKSLARGLGVKLAS
jgi:DNA-binding winged helix-turn-helix (wHTH) protein